MSSAELPGKSGEPQQTFVVPAHRPTSEELIRHSYPHRPPMPYSGMVSNNALMAFILVGTILLLVGAILVHAAKWEDNLSPIGGILADVGVFMVACFLLLAGVLRVDLSEKIRVGFLIAAALILLAFVVAIPMAIPKPIPKLTPTP